MKREELIEAMARALYVRVNGSPFGFGTFPGTSLEAQCTGHAEAALAAIEAHGMVVVPRDADEWKMLTHTDEEHAMLFELGSFLGAIEYRHVRTGSHWQIDTLSIDDETGELQQDTGWGLNDYTYWRPLPSPPASQEQQT